MSRYYAKNNKKKLSKLVRMARINEMPLRFLFDLLESEYTLKLENKMIKKDGGVELDYSCTRQVGGKNFVRQMTAKGRPLSTYVRID